MLKKPEALISNNSLLRYYIRFTIALLDTCMYSSFKINHGFLFTSINPDGTETNHHCL